jgi:hypothetical protein
MQRLPSQDKESLKAKVEKSERSQMAQQLDLGLVFLAKN